LRQWFRRHARELPWRGTADPYRIWVSEIMLQQTQVATVIPYYTRFLHSFPTLAELAAADEARVLRHWEGLGYYRRARQLHRAAQVIVSQHGGRFPRDPDTIRSLPGIGRYTAGAIASMAWDAQEPILEANTIRLFSRLLAYRGDPTQQAAQRVLWDFSASLLPRRGAGDLNQALMELGSEVCTPREPRCDACPVRRLCPTRAAGLQAQIPHPKQKVRYESVWEAAIVVWRGDNVLLRRCDQQERWAGLWDFPRFPVAPRGQREPQTEMAVKTKELTGLQIRLGRQLAEIKHAVTRYRITLVCHEARWVRGRLHNGHLRWVAPGELEEYPLSVTGRKISRLICP
jgi:A/G-specific adenine glycosylase